MKIKEAKIRQSASKFLRDFILFSLERISVHLKNLVFANAIVQCI